MSAVRRRLVALLVACAALAGLTTMVLTRQASEATVLLSADELTVYLEQYRPDARPVLRGFLLTAKRGEYPTALRELYAFAKANPGFGNCHQIGHAIGLAATRTAATTDQLLELASEDCDQAYLHSVVTYRIAAIPGDREAANRGAQLCYGTLRDNPLLFASCRHALGHAAWEREAPSAQQAYSSFCAFLEPADSEKCVSGVVMNWMEAWVAQRSRVPDSENPSAVCEVFPTDTVHTCPFYVANAMLHGRDQRPVTALAVDRYLQWCFDSPFDLLNASWLFECQAALAKGLKGPVERKLGWERLTGQSDDSATHLEFIRLALHDAELFEPVAAAQALCSDLGADESLCESARAKG